MKKNFVVLLTFFLFLCTVGISSATPITYTVESEYLSALSLLTGVTQITESFEDTSVWGDTNGAVLSNPTVSQGVTWSAYNTTQLGIHTNYGYDGDVGIYDIDGLGNSDAIGAQVSAPEAMFGIGGWFKPYTGSGSNILSMQVDDVTLTETVTLSSGNYSFFGVIDSDGFEGVGFVTTQDFGADLFKIGLGTSPVPEPATMILFGLGLLGLSGISRRKN